MFNKLLAVYAICGCIAAGHWFAHEYDKDGSAAGVGNPAVANIVGMLWPIYASYLVFKED